MDSNAPDLASLEVELAVRARQQAVVAHLGQRALSGIDLQALMDEAVQLLAQTLGVEYCKILQLLPEGEKLLLVAGVGLKEGYVGRAMVDAGRESQAGYTLASKEPVVVEDLRLETRFSGPPLLLEHGVVSGMSVVIQDWARPFGVLEVHTSQRRIFTRDDINFLHSIANIIAAANDRKWVEDSLIALNANLERRVEQGIGYVRLLKEVAVFANEASNVEEALQFVVDRVCTYTGWPVGHVYRPAASVSMPAFLQNRPEQGLALIPTGLWYLGDPEKFETFRHATEQTSLAPGEGMVGRVYASARPAWITNVLNELDFPRAKLASGLVVRSGFAFPVLVGKEVDAVLEFYSDQEYEPNQELLDVMAQIGTQIGLVVERIRAERKLKQREMQLAEAQRLTHIGSWDWDIPTNRVHWSDELYRIYGLEPAEFEASYEGFLERVHSEDRDLVTTVIEKALADRQPFGFKHRILHPDGSTRILQALGKMILDEQGQPVRMLGTAQDLTERVKLEEALHRTINLLESLFEAAPDGVLLVDHEGSIVRLNQQVEAIFGYDRGELLGKQLEILLPERFRDQHEKHRASYYQDPRLRPMGVELDLFGKRKDGSEFPVDIVLSPLKTEQDPLVIAMIRDVTSREQAAEMLRQSEARFRTIFENAQLGMAVVDLDKRILATNPLLETMLGYQAEELHGIDLLSLTHPEDVRIARDLLESLLSGERDHYKLEKRFMRSDGEFMWGSFTVSLVRDAEGNPRFAIKMIEDITARKQIEAELAEVQHRLLESRELERVQLAQELHDVPIQDLYGILYQLNDFDHLMVEQESLEEWAHVRGTVQGVINTLREICGELRSPTLAPFGLEGAIREHAEQFQNKHPHIIVNLDLKHDGKGLPEQMRLNLFRIYQQAMTNVVRHAEATEVSVTFTWDENKVVLQIQDNGLGFEVPPRWIGLVRKGHLGLVGAAERAELIGGRFQVLSKPGEGTLIKVSVPRNQEGGISSYPVLM